MTKLYCVLCGRAFVPRSGGGRAQRFCSKECTKAYWQGVRIHGDRQFRRGQLTAAALLDTLPSSCKLRLIAPAAISASEEAPKTPPLVKLDSGLKEFAVKNPQRRPLIRCNGEQ